VPAVKGNKNALKTGVYARVLLTCMPKKFIGIQRAANDFRATLEAAVVERRGGISITQALAINTATTNERLGRLWAKRLSAEYDKMDHAAVALATDRIARHAAARDKAVEALGLDRTTEEAFREDYLAMLRAPINLPSVEAGEGPVASEVTQGPGGAGESILGDVAGNGGHEPGGDSDAEPVAEALIQATDLLDPEAVAYGDDLGVAADDESSDENQWGE
jgi:hypothetical protein